MNRTAGYEFKVGAFYILILKVFGLACGLAG